MSARSSAGSAVFDRCVEIGSVSGGGVALWAHIGGFIAGFILACLVKIFQPVTEVCIIPVPDCKTNDDDVKAEKKKK